MTFFRAENLAINFGGIRAVDDVSFTVQKGEVFTIIGPNGAGKTTIFNLVSRIYDPSAGRLLFEGNDITATPPHRIAELGIARTFQNIELFEHATLLQNLLLARHVHRKTGFFSELLFLPSVQRMEVEHREAVEKVIEFLDLQQYRDALVVNLPYGVRKIADGKYEKVCIGTTTSARMVRFTEPLGAQYGVRAICGKGGFPDEAIEPMQRLGMVYFAIVGGAAALETTQIEEIEEVAWEELMPECLWKFRVKDFGPLTVGIDAHATRLDHDVHARAHEKLKELYARL